MNIDAKILKKAIHQICFRIKLKNMDDLWYIMGGSCFGVFPPSFYYTHTEEEIKRITAEKMEKIQKMITEIKERRADSGFSD